MDAEFCREAESELSFVTNRMGSLFFSNKLKIVLDNEFPAMWLNEQFLAEFCENCAEFRGG